MSNESKLDLTPLIKFLKQEKELEEKGKEEPSSYDKLRFVGYALDIGYDKTTIITSDPYKINVGGIPRNSFLIMVPQDYEQYPPNVIILQVLDAAETPLKKEVQQTYFELHKKSMPELDRFTQSELQWGALETDVLGMFYYNPDKSKENEIEFSHDLVNYVSAHKYRVYSPPKEILDIITNSLIPNETQFSIGKLRTTENRLGINERSFPDVDVKVSTKDFLGARTALFGKTRLGKSNTVKIIAQSVIETTRDQNVGQLIFDIDGEYANDNPQDGNMSIKSVYADDCVVYSFNPRDAEVRPLKLNFYEHPNESIRVLAGLLEERKRNSIYITAFTSSEFPPLESLEELEMNERRRVTRRILMYWAILRKAGFPIDDAQLPRGISLNPNYSANLRGAAYDGIVPEITNLNELRTEFETIARYIRRTNADQQLLQSASGNPLFDSGEYALLNFLLPTGGRAGPPLIVPFHGYHDPNAGDANSEILDFLDEGKTVILDLSNAHPNVLEYFSKKLAYGVFHHQEEKFVENQLPEDSYIQLYFEEAHNLFPKDEDNEAPDIYKRIAKEGAKFHIGMIYSTQSVTTINPDLLAQTENFFIAHMSSQDELRALIKTNLFFKNFERDILKAKTVGYLRIITRSHRYVIPVQIKKFAAEQIED